MVIEKIFTRQANYGLTPIMSTEKIFGTKNTMKQAMKLTKTKSMHNTKLALCRLMGLLVILISSCSNPKKEAFDFVTANGKIGNVNLFDSAHVIKSCIDEWKKSYNVQSRQEPHNLDKRIIVNVELSKKSSVELHYNVVNSIIIGIEVHPSFRVKDEPKEVENYYKLIRDYINPNFNNIGGNTFESKTDKSAILTITGEGNLRYNQLYYYSDFTSILTASAEKFYEKIRANRNAKIITVDYRDGITISPEDKIWVLKTKKLVSPAMADTTKNGQAACGCNYITVDNMQVLPDIVINNHCLRLKGVLSAGENGSFKNYGGGTEAIYADENIYEIMDINNFDYTLLPPNTSLCVPKLLGSAIQLMEIEEYNLTDFPELQTSLQMIKRMGFKQGELAMVRLFNAKF